MFEHDLKRLNDAPFQMRILPDPVLKTETSPVPGNLKGLKSFAERMIDFMKASGGIGLAAPQIGLSLQIITLGIKHFPNCLINPEIHVFNGEEETDMEACLSIPDRNFRVSRFQTIEVCGLTPSGDPVCRTLCGFNARVVQHELDHLKGILIPDRGEEIFDVN